MCVCMYVHAHMHVCMYYNEIEASTASMLPLSTACPCQINIITLK